MLTTKEDLKARGLSDEWLKLSEWKPRAWTWRTIVIHWLQMRLRNRLCCPKCKAIGTYKPRQHPDYRYWVCKYCGYGRTPAGEWKFRPDGALGVWGFHSPASTSTPQERINDPQWKCPCDPWVG